MNKNHPQNTTHRIANSQTAATTGREYCLRSVAVMMEGMTFSRLNTSNAVEEDSQSDLTRPTALTNTSFDLEDESAKRKVPLSILWYCLTKNASHESHFICISDFR